MPYRGKESKKFGLSDLLSVVILKVQANIHLNKTLMIPPNLTDQNQICFFYQPFLSFYMHVNEFEVYGNTCVSLTAECGLISFSAAPSLKYFFFDELFMCVQISSCQTQI